MQPLYKHGSSVLQEHGTSSQKVTNIADPLVVVQSLKSVQIFYPLGKKPSDW